jgi:hypothetical protein
MKVGKARSEYVTPEFLEYVLRVFYETMNAREVGRRLTDLYATQALAETRKAARTGLFPTITWAQCTESAPRCRALRGFILQALSGFLTARVECMRSRQYVYNAQGLRHD